MLPKMIKIKVDRVYTIVGNNQTRIRASVAKLGQMSIRFEHYS